eukprot:COSAG02_NODE_36556_length_453_cov_0.788136_1_plen_36_part_01
MPVACVSFFPLYVVIIVTPGIRALCPVSDSAIFNLC